MVVVVVVVVIVYVACHEVVQAYMTIGICIHTWYPRHAVDLTWRVCSGIIPLLRARYGAEKAQSR